MRASNIFASVLTIIAVSACTKKEGESSIAPVVSAPAEEDSGAKGKCEALGCKGEGSFSDKCNCKGKPQEVPFEAKPTGKYLFKKPEWEVTNKTGKDIHWASAAVYYYDESGKQLEATIKNKPYKSSRINGSSFTLKPKETKTIAFGFTQESAPAGTASIEVEFDGWCFGTYADKESQLCIYIERAPDERSKTGK